jgi:RNA-directed DNA polymerase
VAVTRRRCWRYNWLLEFDIKGLFDKWMERNFPKNPWARYADDAVTHCRTKEEAAGLLERLHGRFNECGLELHPDKTRIVYCEDDDCRGDYPEIKFYFLGYTFRPRRSKNRYGKFFINFLFTWIHFDLRIACGK